MKFITNVRNTISCLRHSIVTLYHRIIGTTQAEYRTLKARLEALEVATAAHVQELKREVEEKECQIFALESKLTTDLSKHLEAIKHLAATKRESPNVQGERPELLR